MSEFVRMLIGVSEKAANIARIIRSEKELFNLLVEEKPEIQKNDRFVQDFKTLSDVLIQECLRHEISAVFPMMANNIFGEECNTFTNILGESVTIAVKETVEKTAQLLAKVLNGNIQAAQILAEEVHREIPLNGNETLSYLSNDFIESYDDVGIWIDPIDATNEYIRGSYDDQDAERHVDEEVIFTSGLHCVTVLIGAFNLTTGTSIVGVINQPFWKFDSVSKKWSGRTFWGVSVNGQRVSSLTRYPVKRQQNHSKKVIIVSSSEDERLQNALKSDFHFVSSSGAGYKLLCVALGLADIYILTKKTTHFWDTCAAHAIMKSLGGNILRYDSVIDGHTFDGQSKTKNVENTTPENEAVKETVERESAKNCNGKSESVNNSNGYHTGCGCSNNKPRNTATARLHKLGSFSELTYSVNNPCDKDANFANRGGVFAYREISVANSAIECLRRHLNIDNHNSDG